LGVDGSEGVRFPPSHYQLLASQQHSTRSESAVLHGHGSQLQSEEEGQDSQQQQQQWVQAEEMDVEGLCELIMLICSKAMALGFICGPNNSYSSAAVVAFNTVSTHLSAAAMQGAASGTQGAADPGCNSIAMAATEAR
jgi:hypothetical protein